MGRAVFKLLWMKGVLRPVRHIPLHAAHQNETTTTTPVNQHANGKSTFIYGKHKEIHRQKRPMLRCSVRLA